QLDGVKLTQSDGQGKSDRQRLESEKRHTATPLGSAKIHIRGTARWGTGNSSAFCGGHLEAAESGT
ncbi:MAG TPA: hypothetical protein VFK80_00295, partial [Limnochordia bacterium]|nr:hypothetical protein [Limnochordia bacterium]